MTDAVAALIGVGLSCWVAMNVVQAYLLLRLIRALAATRRIESQLSHYGDALSLLTETAEAGFRTLAAEVGRAARSDTGVEPARPTTSRVASAARRGKTVHEIAAAEQVSEGEVQLRLHLATHGEPTPCAGAAGARHRAGTNGNPRRNDGSLRA